MNIILGILLALAILFLLIAVKLCRMSRFNQCPRCYCLHNRLGDTVRLMRPTESYSLKYSQLLCPECFNDPNRPVQFKTCNHYE